MEHKEGRKKGRKSSKVGTINESYEMEGEASETVKQKVSPFLNNILEAQAMKKSNKVNPLVAVSEAKAYASRWKDFVTKKRIKKKATTMSGPDNADTLMQDSSLGLDDLHEDYLKRSEKVFGSSTKTMSSASNRALIQYFARLGHSKKDDEVVDLDFVETLLQNGADINCTDRHGQTLLHEVASKWHTDVAKFLIDQGADVNKPDVYGRTPLHVAAADDYPDMIELLVINGAKLEAKTIGELQTPVHYAARNDAAQAVRTLIKHGCHYKTVKDFKGRTPLYVAAELDRSESAHELLELEAPAGVCDNKGHTVISWMITKMPLVAYSALNQFHSTDRPNRRQYFFINLLVQDRKKDPEGSAASPLAVAVRLRQFDLLTHPVFLSLLNVMWTKFARWRAYASLLFNFVYIILWTVYGITPEYIDRHKYVLPEQWWRIALLVAAVGITIWQIIDEVREYRRSLEIHNSRNERRGLEIDEDMQYCHPRWPAELKFLKEEKSTLEDTGPRYWTDAWNIFDWVCYAFLMAVIGTHVADIAAHSDTLARAHIRLTAVTIILLWLRLMKNVRAFATLGPFIVMLGHILTDLVKIAYLYLEFYIPYVCAFYMIFGGNKFPENSVGNPNATEVTVPGMEDFNAALFTLFRLTLVDEYAYESMKEIDSIMTDILVGTWLVVSAILCLNLFIALLSDSFQRVYDNAQANAVMQKAMTILSIWEGLSTKSQAKFLDHIDKTCSPLSQYYDDDLTEVGGEDLKKATLQIRDELEQLRSDWEEQFGSSSDNQPSALEELKADNVSLTGTNMGMRGKMVTNAKFEVEMDSLRSEMRSSLEALQKQQTQFFERFKRDMKVVKTMMLDMPPSQGRGGDGGGGGAMVYGEDVEGFSGGGYGTHRDTEGLAMTALTGHGDSSSAMLSMGHRPKSSGKKKKKKKGMTDAEDSLLEPPLPGEIMMRGAAPGYFARPQSSGQPTVEVSTARFPTDPLQVDIRDQRSTTSTDPDHSTA